MNLAEIFTDAEAGVLRKAINADRKPRLRYVRECEGCGVMGVNTGVDGAIAAASALLRHFPTTPSVSLCDCGRSICSECYTSARCPCASRG